MSRRRQTTKETHLTAAASVLILSFSGSAAYAQASEIDFDIKAQPLAKALNEFSAQADMVVMASGDLVAGKTAPAVDGVYEPQEALSLLLKDSGLSTTIDASGAIVVTQISAEATEPASEPFRVAQLDQANDGTVETIRGRRSDDVAEDDIDTIIVTGTNIRGIAPESSPVRSYSREDIQITGAATAQDFIQTLPQNFGGGSNETIGGGLPNNVDAASNLGGGSSVNLRGLGSGSTLVLVNGRRVAPSSDLGDFVDISLIPASAIERVDVLTDGASSIYGADAVAGVVNFVLRDDYDGAEASVRYGSVTEGNLDEFRAGLTGGKSWDAGNILAAYEFYSRTSLSAEDRAFSQGAPLPNDLLPSQRRHSVLASASHEVMPGLDLSADFGFSTRETELQTTSVGPSVFRDNQTNTLNASLGVSWEAVDNWFVDLSGTYSRVDLEQQPFEDR